jgi:hypothetical protein
MPFSVPVLENENVYSEKIIIENIGHYLIE